MNLFDTLGHYFNNPAGFSQLQSQLQENPPPDGLYVRFPVPPSGVVIDNLRGFAEQCFGDAAWVEQLPAEFPLDGQIYLTRLEADQPTDLTQSSLFAGFEWSDFTWEIIPGLQITSLGLTVGVQNFSGARAYTLEAYGTIWLADIPFTVLVDVNNQIVRGFLAPGSQVALAPLLEQYHLDGFGFDDLTFSTIALMASTNGSMFNAMLVADDVWRLGGDNLSFEVQKLGFGLTHLGKPLARSIGVASGQFELDINPTSPSAIQVLIELSAAYNGPDSGWDLSGAASLKASGSNPSIGDIADAIGQKFGFQNLASFLPSPVSTVSITDLGLSFNTRTKNFTFRSSASFDGVNVDSKPPIAIDISLTRNPQSSYDKHFSGQIQLHTSLFDLIFDQHNTSSTFLAAYKNPGAQAFTLSDLVGAVSSDTANVLSGVPESFSFKIKDALLAYRKDGAAGTFLFAIDMDVGVNLSGLGELPLIGKLLPTDQALTLAFQALAGSKPTGAGIVDWSDVAGLIPDGSPHLPDNYAGGFQLITTLRMGDLTRQLDLGFDGKQNGAYDPNVGSPNPTALPDAATPAPDPAGGLAGNPNITWIDLQKHFGPLNFQRVGLGYQNGKIDVLLDASFAVGPLSLALDGLGAEYDLSSKALTFTLHGLGLDFSRGPLAIGGAFLRMGDDFAGEAMIRTENLAITALGAFGQAQGNPSLFIYAAINYPIGGPSFFFVEGLAAGFGVNRRLLMPPVQQIHTFPLVAAAIDGASMPPVDASNTMAQVVEGQLTLLEKYVPPQLGEYFFAVGLRFTSFKLIDCFALLALSVGKQFEIDVLGVATATEPPQAAPGTPVLARAQLEFMVKFAPDEGLLAAQGQLTPQSYLYDPACQLQGGFAMYNWFSGEHAGDFVTTLGGYGPLFHPPSHYPAVPQLGFNWQVTSQMLIKGAAYFAMTPNAIMAGGSLQATYEDGSISAWFTASADFLLFWKPFHYTASASVEIGAALTIHCFGTHHVTISAGAEVDIWGPQFSGRAHVHVKVLIVHVNFTVAFGDSSQNAPPKLGWDEFKNSFLPDDKVCGAAVQGGLIRMVKDGDDDRWIVNAKELCLVTDSLVPSTRTGALDVTSTDGGTWDTLTASPLELSEANSDSWSNLYNNDWLKGNKPAKQFAVLDATPKLFGIDPMGVDSSRLQSLQVIRVVKDGTGNASLDFVCIPVYKQVPCALWNQDAGPASGPSAAGPQTIQALTGYQLHPAKPPTPGATCFIRDDSLQYDVAPRDLVQDTATQVSYTTDGSPDLSTSFTDAATVQQRATLLESLGFLPARDVALSESLIDAFVIAPQVVVASTGA